MILVYDEGYLNIIWDTNNETILYFFTELKPYHLSYSIYKYDAIDIADPSSMQDACHMNFVIELAQRRVSVVEHRRFDSSWELRIFSLSHASDKTKHISLYFFTELKTYHLSNPNEICVL